MISTDRHRLRAVRQLFGGAAVALAAWFCIVVLITVVFDPTSDVVVVGPSHRVLDAALALDARIENSGWGFLIVATGRPGSVRALYAGGAYLVLPSPSGGCLGTSRVALANRRSERL